jgi:SAM-dependent methyltransferase
MDSLEAIGCAQATKLVSEDGDDERCNTQMNQNKALWEKGDFTRIAESMRESGEALVMTLGITDGLDVLDLGCGDGTTALPAAKLGADVLGVDIASNLVDAGNARARSLGLTNCRVQEGDASDLSDIDDNSFDLLVSIFGAMFAPRPFDVAKEMVRVTRPGGRIVMGNWIPNDPTLAAANGREAELHGELDALFNSQNTSPSEDVTSIPATFLRVSVAA